MVYDINKYLFRRKQGAALGAGLGALGLIGSSMFGAMASDNATQANEEQAEKSRQFNHDEAELARNWQFDTWNYQYDRQMLGWFKQFNAQNNQWYNQQNFLNNQWRSQQDYSNQQAYQYWLKQQQYNSPSEMVGRLNSAGLNAAAAINAQQFGSTGLSAAPVGAQVAPVSSPSSVSPSMPSASPASIGTVNPAQASNGASAFANIVGGVSDLVKSFAGARKDNIEAVKAEKTLSTYISQKLADLKNSELLNQWQDMQNVFFHEKAPKELKKLGEEINVLSAKVLLMSSEQDLIDNQSITEGFKQALMGVQKNLTNEQFMQAVIFTSQYEQRLLAELDLKREEILTQKSAQSRNFAESFKLRAEGKTEEDLRSLRHDSLELSNDIAKATRYGLHLDNWLKDETKRAKAHAIIEQAKQSGLITQKEVYELASQIDNYDVRKVNRFFQWLGQGVGAYRDFGIGTSALNGFPSSGSKGSFDPNAGNSFIMDNETGLLFKSPWSK